MGVSSEGCNVSINNRSDGGGGNWGNSYTNNQPSYPIKDEFIFRAAENLTWDSWHRHDKVSYNSDEFASIGGRPYSRHAVQCMNPSGLGYEAGDRNVGEKKGDGSGEFGHGIAPRFVEMCIISGSKSTQGDGSYMYRLGNVAVVLNSDDWAVRGVGYRKEKI